MGPADIVKAYYLKVDTGDVGWVIDLFADSGEYQRADAMYRGKEAIARFYTSERKIRGKHSLENVVVDANTVIANGVFEGTGDDGMPKTVGFADVWLFDREGLVSSRKTYLAIGSDYVKD